MCGRGGRGSGKGGGGEGEGVFVKGIFITESFHALLALQRSRIPAWNYPSSLTFSIVCSENG